MILGGCLSKRGHKGCRLRTTSRYSRDQLAQLVSPHPTSKLQKYAAPPAHYILHPTSGYTTHADAGLCTAMSLFTHLTVCQLRGVLFSSLHGNISFAKQLANVCGLTHLCSLAQGPSMMIVRGWDSSMAWRMTNVVSKRVLDLISRENDKSGVHDAYSRSKGG